MFRIPVLAGRSFRSTDDAYVVADVREVDLKGPVEAVVYVPLDQVDDRFLASMRVWLQTLSWSVRTRVAPASILPAIQERNS